VNTKKLSDCVALIVQSNESIFGTNLANTSSSSFNEKLGQ